MPGTKRSSKVVSYNEEEDDDDFIPIVNKTKKPNEAEKAGSKPPEKVEPVKEEITLDEESAASDENELSESEEQDENLSPKTKRVKNEVIEEESTDKPIIPLASTTPTSNPTNNRHSSVPLGFPTSKIHIPSPHVSRVGLSRKSLPSKSLHPNYTSRVPPE